MRAIIEHVDSQLLQSNLSDSMLEGTGFPPNIAELDNYTIQGPPILVEIVAMTEIGHSAFSLQNIRQARIERADLAGLAEEEEGGDEDAGVPNYPRSMLKFHLSDGSTVMEAIEYRRIPGIQLGETPLGYKVRLTFLIFRFYSILNFASFIHLILDTTQKRTRPPRHRFLRAIDDCSERLYNRRPTG